MNNEIRNIVLTMILTASGLIYGAYLFEKAGCEVKGESFESVKYSFAGGCIVKHKGKWLPLDNLHILEGKKVLLTCRLIHK